MTGERLGGIGQDQQHGRSGSTLPSKWKSDLTSKPSISTRKGIAFGYEEPFENTSTLVLTARSGKFIDVRFANGQDPTDERRGFWAFAGIVVESFPSADISSHSNNDAVEIPYMVHCKWNHTIDSKEVATDEGDMFLLPNGDCAEVGIMADVHNGQMKIYKEYWTAYPGPRLPCLVAESEDGRGAIIRIGDHSQGIIQRKKDTTCNSTTVWVERWIRISDESGGHKTTDWKKDWRSNTGPHREGDGVMPMMWACEESRRDDDKTTVDGTIWKIVEVGR